ncbi:MAG TPA: hypothetical protein VLA61_19595 [Ideonella sp.]|uniref:hypothetical protein n=1 Tax=Ideonella sp. TaxID=1929293 RepID=UPI002D0D065A|nr:hypothetical protein [Ideonella sp.]HSI50476.1 hypothetical protein [Ideonella sp.]
MTRSPVRLILHAGCGKTGTTSIQATLAQARPALEAQGVWYLGLTLEHAPVVHHAWQQFGGPPRLNALPHAQAVDEIHEILSLTVDAALARGIHTLIWSSESLIDRPEKAIAAIQRLDPTQVDRHVLIYVRRHDAWAVSAYVQWGIRHKTYRGRLQHFALWVERRGGVRFHQKIQRFAEAFPDKLTLRNFDHAHNAVADFLAVCRIDASGITELRGNVTADDTELYLRALFNDQCHEPQFPMAFNKVIARAIRHDSSPDALLHHLLGADPLPAGHEAQVQADRLRVNRWLAASHSPPLAETGTTPAPPRVDRQRLLLALAALALDQGVRIQQLEARLAVPACDPAA